MADDNNSKPAIPFTEMLKTVLAHYGYDDNEDEARHVLRLCDELGCTVEDLPTRRAEHEREMERKDADDAERIGYMAGMLASGVTPMLPPDELHALRSVSSAIVSLSAKMEATEASTAPSKTEDPS